jgi:hypothetical protein
MADCPWMILVKECKGISNKCYLFAVKKRYKNLKDMSLKLIKSTRPFQGLKDLQIYLHFLSIFHNPRMI